MQLGYTDYLIIGDCAVNKNNIVAIGWDPYKNQIIVTIHGGRQIFTHCTDKTVLDNLFTKPKTRKTVKID